MTIRDAIDQMLADLELGADPAEVLADHGFEDVSSEALSSALIHFAERAPLAVADALAPIVTRVSPVPFAEGDLPDVGGAEAILAEGGDVLALLSEVGLAERADAGTETETDPGSGIDDDGDAATDALDQLTDGIEPAADDAESTFGIGDEDLPSLDDIDVELEEFDDAGALADAAEAAIDDALDEGFDGLDTASFTDLFDQAANAAGIDELDDTDPSDLDLD
ncbi:MAG: hypothetical protein OEV40_15310 [Acidimicrobiia bacterium]|nr:hypothetical protein [Acidimicrobiia bacterium]